MRDPRINVCDKCFKRSCWDWIFPCDEARDAGLVLKTRAELVTLDREHTSYFDPAFEEAGPMGEQQG